MIPIRGQKNCPLLPAVSQHYFQKLIQLWTRRESPGAHHSVRVLSIKTSQALTRQGYILLSSKNQSQVLNPHQYNIHLNVFIFHSRINRICILAEHLTSWAVACCLLCSDKENGFDVIMGGEGVFLRLLWVGKRSVFGLQVQLLCSGRDQLHLYLAILQCRYSHPETLSIQIWKKDALTEKWWFSFSLRCAVCLCTTFRGTAPKGGTGHFWGSIVILGWPL